MNSQEASKRISVLMAFDHLCRHHPFDDITVQDICDASGVSRSSFYRSFASKYHISTWYQDLLLEASLGEAGRTLDWCGAFSAYHSGWRLFPAMNLAAKGQGGIESTEALWPPKVCSLVLETLRLCKGIEAEGALLFHIHYFSITTRPQSKKPMTPWVDEIYDCSPQEYGSLMAATVPHDLYQLLNEPVNPGGCAVFDLSTLFMRAQRGQGV